MHHTLKFYNQNRQGILKFYMFFASWTRVPLLGRLVWNIANAYGRSQHHAYLLNPAEALELLTLAGGIAQAPCTCRTIYQKCHHPLDNEILLTASHHILSETMPKGAQEITAEKAREILQDSQRRGLVLTILKCREDYYAICSCCTCCCVPLRLSKRYNIGEAVVRHKDIIKEFKEYVAAQRASHPD